MVYKEQTAYRPQSLGKRLFVTHSFKASLCNFQPAECTDPTLCSQWMCWRPCWFISRDIQEGMFGKKNMSSETVWVILFKKDSARVQCMGPFSLALYMRSVVEPYSRKLS